MATQFSRTSVQKISLYGVDQLTAPSFGGITSVNANADGSFTLNWAAATAPSGCVTPIEYITYIALGSVSSATLFQSSNIYSYTPFGNLSAKVFTLANGTTYLIRGQVYTFGVRAKSATGISENGTAILTETAIGSGNLPQIFQDLANSLTSIEQDLAQDHVDLAADIVDLQNENVDLANSITTLDGINTDLANIETDLQNDVDKVETAANLLITTVL
jgi:hypothetical protein